MGSADHDGRPMAHWAPPPPICSGGLPPASLTLFHVPGLWIYLFDAACGPLDPCEPEFYTLIGLTIFPVDHKVLTTCI